MLLFYYVSRGTLNGVIIMPVDKMNVALEQARIAYSNDEIPVGCAIFRGNELIACGYNKKESVNDAILHAEIIAISSACRKLGRWRLDDCCLYVTLEPCMMCMGAILESRIGTVYYGIHGKNEQMFNLLSVIPSISTYNLNCFECSAILSDFFEKKRKN